MSVQDGLLTVEDVAQKLRLSRYTVRKWVRLGRLPAVRLGDRRIRFMSEAVERWVREQRV